MKSTPDGNHNAEQLSRGGRPFAGFSVTSDGDGLTLTLVGIDQRLFGKTDVTN
jgi:hypothetical protein